MKGCLPLMNSVLTPFAKGVLVTLGLTAIASRDAETHKKIL